MLGSGPKGSRNSKMGEISMDMEKDESLERLKCGGLKYWWNLSNGGGGQEKHPSEHKA